MNTDISPESFQYLQKFLGETSGYNLTADKEYLVTARLKIVSEAHKIDEFEKIIHSVRMNPGGAISLDVIEAMTVNETFFFRDDSPFKIFKDTTLPLLKTWSKDHKIKIWSAACSAGQEPYSIAMILDTEMRHHADFKYEIHASDINKTVVQKARDGVYSHLEVNRGLPEIYKKKYFTETGNNKWKIQDDLRTKIEFFEHNLCADKDNYKGSYDVVFLRNVLIYFEEKLKNKVLEKICRTMKPGGFLFLGTSENIYNADLDFEREPGLTGIYRKKS